MNRGRPPARPLLVRLTPLLVAALSLPPAGCLAYKVVSAPVKVAATTVVVAGEAATAAVTATGKIAVSAVHATGSITSSGIDAAASLARAGMVTFADTASGTVVRIPWTQGLTLAGASTAAKIRLAQRAVRIVRDGRQVLAATRAPATNLALHSGDVVELRP